jgi:hypothetical protein
MTCRGYANMFFLYGPSCAEAQGNCIMNAIGKIEKEGIKNIDPTREAEEEQEWRRKAMELSDKTLFHKADGWYRH